MLDWTLVVLIFGALVALVAYRERVGALFAPILGAIIFVGGMLLGRLTIGKNEASEEPKERGPRYDDDLDEITAHEVEPMSDAELADWIDEHARGKR